MARESWAFIPPNAPSGCDLLPIFAANDAYICGMGNGNDWRKKMTKKTAAQGSAKTQDSQRQSQQQAAPGETGLHQRYGTIGIDAVAAAVRYSNPGKHQDEPVKAPRIDQRFEQGS